MVGRKQVNFQNVIEGDDVRHFFQQFILPPELAQSAPNGFPKDIETVIADVQEVWDKKGLITPAELRAELLTKYLHNSSEHPPEALVQFVRDAELSRNRPEQVTGYLDKEHAYLATGLNHYYAQSRGQQVLALEVDYSNMGGTNEEFQKRIAAERGIRIEDVPEKAYMNATDSAVKAMSLGMVHDLKEHYPNIDVMAIRTGGDELRLMMRMKDGSPVSLQTQMEISDIIHAGVEERAATLGLQDHAHLKNPTDPRRNGFGAAVAVVDMQEINSPEAVTHWVQDADARIKIAKLNIGALRRGEIDEDLTKLEIQRKIQAGELKVPDGMDKEKFVAQQLAEARVNAEAAGQALRDLNPYHNGSPPPTMADYERRVGEMIAQSGETGTPAADLPRSVADPVPIGADRPAGVEPCASLSRRRFALAADDISGQAGEAALTDLHKYVLRQTIGGLSATDPSSRVSMPGDSTRLIEAYSAEIGEFREHVRQHQNDPDVKAALDKAGIHSVEEIKPHVMAYSLHGLAAMNDTLGHHGADLALRTLGKELVNQSFAEVGLPTDARSPITMAHHGGGNFSLVIGPGMVDRDGHSVFVSEDMLHKAQERLQEKITDLNNLPIAEAFQKMGVELTPQERERLRSMGVEHLSDLPDSKDRAVKNEHGDVVAKAKVNGVAAVTSTSAVQLDGQVNGAEILGDTRNSADQKMGSLREQRVLASQQGEVSHPAAPSPAAPPPAAPPPAAPPPAAPPPAAPPPAAPPPAAPPPAAPPPAAPPPAAPPPAAPSPTETPHVEAPHGPGIARGVADTVVPTTRGGVAATAAFAGAAAGLAIYNGGNVSDAANAAYHVVNPYAETLAAAVDDTKTKLDVAETAATDTATLGAAAAAGTVAGTAASAWAVAQTGAVLGSAAGPVGTAAGFVVGAVGGYFGAKGVDEFLHSETKEKIQDFVSRNIIEAGINQIQSLTNTFNLFGGNDEPEQTIQTNALDASRSALTNGDDPTTAPTDPENRRKASPDVGFIGP